MTEKRNDVIQIRVSAEEKMLIEANAKEHGVKISEWVRDSALTRREKYPKTFAEFRGMAVEQTTAVPEDTAYVASTGKDEKGKPAISASRLRFFNK